MKRWTTILAFAAAAIAAPAAADAPRNAYEQAAVDAVQAHINVYRDWDLDAFVQTFTDDAMVMVDGEAFDGHAKIRDYYASAFADDPHTVRVIESGVRKGLVYITTTDTFEDGKERCCTYAQYFVKDGKIAYLDVKISGRSQLVRRAEDEAQP